MGIEDAIITKDNVDIDLYRRAVGLYQQLETGSITIFYVNEHKYVRIKDYVPCNCLRCKSEVVK